MNKKCRIRMARRDYQILKSHLFQEDNDEHGAVLLAGISCSGDSFTFYVREIHLACDGKDYVPGKIGYRALSPTFIHRLITRARDQRLAYLAVHNHATDRSVSFSQIDLDSHERGYPALLQIARGMPVGGLVLGQRSMEADIWLANGDRCALEEAVIVGNTIESLTPSSRSRLSAEGQSYDRQVMMFGKMGQAKLARCRVAVLGLGGIGSLVAEYLARLGVGHFYLVDDDRVEESNLSRIVGASSSDAHEGVAKVTVAQRLILQANCQAQITGINDDVAKESVAKELTACDYLFLAADSMRARLVFNALVHQYFIPGVQLGSKVRSDTSGTLIDALSVNRVVRPGEGCLWCNQLIDSNVLALEAKTDAERKAQAYGVQELNPSVITINAISASHAVNDFLFDYLNLRDEAAVLHYEYFQHLNRRRLAVEPRKDADCSECSATGSRYGRGDSIPLPCIEG